MPKSYSKNFIKKQGDKFLIKLFPTCELYHKRFNTQNGDKRNDSRNSKLDSQQRLELSHKILQKNPEDEVGFAYVAQHTSSWSSVEKKMHIYEEGNPINKLCTDLDLRGGRKSTLVTRSMLESLVREFPNLETLCFAKNKFENEDISPLVKWTRLERLDLSHCNIEDLSSLTGLKETLRVLRISYNVACANFTFLSDMKNLENLWVDYTNFRNEDLTHLTRLISLNLKSCELQDISKISELSNLQYLNINDNFIADLTPISKLNQLKMVFADRYNLNLCPSKYDYSCLDSLEESGAGIIKSDPYC